MELPDQLGPQGQPVQQGDLLENIPPPPPGPTIEELAEKLRVLKRIVEITLVALVFLAAALNAFLWRQTLGLSRQLAEVKRYVAEYQQTKEPVIRGFISSLQGFARTHADFQPILAKYIDPASLKPAVAPVVAPGKIPAPPNAK